MSNSASGPALVDGQPRVRPPGRSFCVLSFDGGGHRGYSSLLMLKRILRGIVPENEGPVFPYQYFDLICGTSTGGLIAILLAVLHLDIDNAISCYKRAMSREGRQRWWWGQGSQHTLTMAIQEVIREHGCENRQMDSSTHDKGCKCFVTAAAITKGNALGAEPTVHLIRSYKDPTGKPSPPWTVLDAALATTAAPALFRNHTITHENFTYQFEDAGIHGLSNPTIIAWDECDRLDPSTPPYCIVSLGTGLKRNTAIDTDKPASYWLFEAFLTTFMPFTGARGWQKASANRDAKDIDEKMVRLTRKMDPNPYFRFDPDIDAAGDLSPSNSKATPLMDHDVYNYIEENGPLFDRCSRRLALP